MITPDLNWISILNYVNMGIVLAYLISSIVIFARHFLKAKCTSFLSFHLFTIGWVMIHVIAFYNRQLIYEPWLTQIHLFAAYAIAPSLYLYVIKSFHADFSLSFKDLIHYLPAVLSVFLIVPFCLLSEADQVQFAKNLYRPNHPYVRVQVCLFFIQQLAYLILSIRRTRVFHYELKQYDRAYQNTFNFARLLTLVTVAQLGAISVPVLVSYSTRTALFIPMMMIPKLWIICQNCIKSGHVLQGVSGWKSHITKTTTDTDLQSDTLHELGRLIKLVEAEKLYKDVGLSLHKLADQLGTKSYLLSIYLKREMNTNFYNYINGLRVAEAKRLLQSDMNKDYTLEYLGQLAGFRSKSVFFTRFKKLAGVTPQQWANSTKDDV
ncbi:MAG: helix-turn-helix transcriptional regulator [Cyclobacteriaceae bacterium]|nr:helix-turn-helix transcriptional regulator [Cyclobacteriaceae bacterium HetDA_MAG_MS6]